MEEVLSYQPFIVLFQANIESEIGNIIFLLKKTSGSAYLKWLKFIFYHYRHNMTTLTPQKYGFVQFINKQSMFYIPEIIRNAADWLICTTIHSNTIQKL